MKNLYQYGTITKVVMYECHKSETNENKTKLQNSLKSNKKKKNLAKNYFQVKKCKTCDVGLHIDRFVSYHNK